MTTMHGDAVVRDGTRPRPSVLGSVGYLVMNLPVGIAGFVAVITLFSVGVGTAVVWVGLPVLAVAIVGVRGAAMVERARVYAMLDTYIAVPYAPLPTGRGRWKTRVRDKATWRDAVYFLLMLPLGLVEFTLVVTFWVVALSFTLLPLYIHWLPAGEVRFWDWDHPWLVVDSFLEALPLTALGLLVLAVAVPLTRGLATGHALFARALLGPAPREIKRYGLREPVFGGV